ncbi:hypothetical protein J2S13_001267 [Oikeobacillus pervagus]|uniref:Uncharacterized protein n=1 Tax=Oikeobacillus pervagus TaxID=1325931 RepID=A0AAJ1SY21_9BACI|nr:hypothetical protein [Oikeobacillus pervagus]MDQ0214870.1 hypothetical protein [Oikeobacillus pervagus]
MKNRRSHPKPLMYIVNPKVVPVQKETQDVSISHCNVVTKRGNGSKWTNKKSKFSKK